MIELIKKIIIGLTDAVSAFNHTKRALLSNQKYRIQPALINLHPNEYSQEFHYYPFAVKLDRCVGSCNDINDLSNKVCVPNKTEDLNLRMFNMITGINESKTLNVDVNVKNGMLVKKDYVWNPATCNFENGKYLASIMDDSAIKCDEIIELYNEETNFDEKKAGCRTQHLCILLSFLLIIIALLIAAIFTVI